MSKVITHHHDEKFNKNNSLFIVILSIIAIICVLLGLNYFLTKSNKNNKQVIENIADNRSIMGDPNAKIKLVEYSDFQCPACAGFSSIFPEVFNYINSKYGSSTLSLTYKYFPLISIHKNALLSAYSAEAAKMQGKFWELEKVLFEKQDEWGEALDAKSKIEGYARDLGLDMNKFVLDRDSQNVKDTVNNSLDEAVKLGLTHTPFVFMNGEEMKDLQLSASAIEKIIEDKLNGVVSSSSTINNTN